MTDLDKARVWAECTAGLAYNSKELQAAAEIIQSLPDQWIDAEKLREVVSNYEGNRYISEIVQDFADLLPAPKLPTLANMTAEEREACQWMQVKTWCEVGILVWVDEASEIAEIITQNNGALERKFKDVTPLPDLPKLEWPGGVVDCEIVEEPEPVDAPPAEKVALPKPEDVPPNELWIVEYGESQWVAKRIRGWSKDFAWRIASVDGEGIDIARDSQITLIHKLVPEVPALPEGMRLADHEEYGRVVVSPRVDRGDEYKIFILGEENFSGARTEFCKESELTFLDGEA